MKNFRTEGAPRRGGFGGGDRGRGAFGDRDKGRGGFGGGDRGRGGFGGRDSGAPRTMHKTTCAECGKVCEVPFRPTGEKPVFCSTCFAERGDRTEERNDRPSRFAMDREPRMERNSHSDRQTTAPKVDNSRLEEKLEVISAKLDKLFSLLMEKPVKEEKVEKVVVEKKVASKKAVADKKTVSKKVAPKKTVKKK